jgi:uncharacterized delta-60 repeat protein
MGIYTPNSPYPFAIRPQSPNPRIKRPEDATLARYGDLRYLLQNGVGGGAIVDITASEIYNKSLNNELVTGTKYRITDYKSVNWLNGYWNANTNNPPVVVGNFSLYTPVDVNIANGATGGTGVNVVTNDVASVSSGVFVGGDFTQIGSVSISCLQKLNADGTPNAAFNTYYNPAALSPGFNLAVQAIAVQADGKVIVGGNFTSLNSVTRNYLVRLNVDGTVDTAFYTNLGTTFNGNVYSIAIQSDGKILVGGAFSTFNGNARNGLVRLNADGTEDTVFGTNIGTAAGLALSVSKILISQTGAPGKIYILGNFPSWNGGANTLCIARLNSNGTNDPTFVGGYPFGQKSANFIYELANGDILLSNNGSTWSGIPLTSAVYRVSPIGALVNGGWGNVTAGVSTSAVKTIDGGLIIAGNSVAIFDGAAVIAKYNEAGTRDAAYNPGTSFDNIVKSLAIVSNDTYVLCGAAASTTYQSGTTEALIPLAINLTPPYQARAVHVSDPEVLVVTAINGSEVDPMGYSETYGDAVTYIPYFNTLGLVTDFDNGTTLPNNQLLSGFDLQWDSAQNVAYCTMPADYPVRFGNYFYIEFYTTLVSPNDYFYAVIEPVKPGVNYSMDYFTGDLNSEVVVSPDGLTVKFPNITFAQYQAYDPDTLYAETIEKFSDAYGFVQWRKDYSHNVEAPFDWRNYRYRRYEINMFALNPSFGGTFYAATTDSLGATGNYIDVPSFGTYQNVFNNGVDPVVNPNNYTYGVYNVVFRGTPGAINYWYYLGSIDNFWCPYMYELDINSNYISNATIYSDFYSVTADSLSSFTDCIINSIGNSSISAGIGIICPGGINGCTFGTRGYYAMQILSAVNTDFSIGNLSLGGDKTTNSLSSSYTKSIVYATDNNVYLVENDGSGFVNTPY